jgi:small basic protein (TIGR04137 family)
MSETATMLAPWSKLRKFGSLLVSLPANSYHALIPIAGNFEGKSAMSIDKSLRRKNTLQRARNVLTRGERIAKMQSEERWPDGRSPYGLPKVKVLKLVVKKAKKKEEKAAEGAEGEAAAAPAAAAGAKK